MQALGALNGRATKNYAFDLSYNAALNVRTLGQKPTEEQTAKAQSAENIKQFQYIQTENFRNVVEFAKFLDKGHTIYTGTFQDKPATAAAKYIKHSWVIFFDFDFASILLDEVLEHPFVKKYAAIAHPSYRAVPENIYKFHLYFICDRAVTTQEYKTLWGIIRDALGVKIDSSKRGANNLSYGSLHSPIVISETNRLEVDSLLESIKEKKAAKDTQNREITANVTKPTESLTNQVLEHLDEHLGAIYSSNINKIYFLYPHQLVKVESLTDQDKEDKIIAKFTGNNPWHPSTTGQGNSFAVSVKEGGFPVFFDRSGEFSATTATGQEKNGSHYLIYWYELHNLNAKNDGKASPYPGTFKESFKQIVLDICNHFKIPEFEFKKKINLDEILDYLEEELRPQVYIPQWDDSYLLVYDRKCGIWASIGRNCRAYGRVLNDLISKKFGSEVARNYKVVRSVTSWFENNNWECLPKPLQEELNFIPFQNGDFDRDNQELLPFNSQCFNTHRLDFNYIKVEDDNLVILRFKAFLRRWLNDETVAEFLFLWTILNCQRQAYRTGFTVGLIGDAGTGKSTYGEFLLSLFDRYKMSAFAKKVNADNLTSNSNNHATAVLEDAYVVVLDELKGNTNYTNIEKLKEFTGQTEGVNISVNPKGKSERPAHLRLAITWNRQDMINVPSNDDGFFRRNVIIQLKKAVSKTEQNKNEWEYLRKPENLRILFCWCQQQPTEPILEETIKLSKEKVFEDFKAKTRIENNYIAQWLEENIEITNLEHHFHSCTDLQSDYDTWAEENKASKYGKKNFIKELRATATDNTLGFDWIAHDSYPKRVGSAVQRGYHGLRLRSDEDDTTKSF